MAARLNRDFKKFSRRHLKEHEEAKFLADLRAQGHSIKDILKAYPHFKKYVPRTHMGELKVKERDMANRESRRKNYLDSSRKRERQAREKGRSPAGNVKVRANLRLHKRKSNKDFEESYQDNIRFIQDKMRGHSREDNSSDVLELIRGMEAKEKSQKKKTKSKMEKEREMRKRDKKRDASYLMKEKQLKAKRQMREERIDEIKRKKRKLAMKNKRQRSII